MINVEIPDEIKKEVMAKGGFENIAKSIPDDTIKELVEILKALADEKRLKILYALHRQRMCVCMLAALTQSPYSKCSYHIAKLKDMNLIKAKHTGNYIIYSLTSYGKKIIRYFEKLIR
jgi:DNA-binding transcriptional ArsR family regulator